MGNRQVLQARSRDLGWPIWHPSSRLRLFFDALTGLIIVIEALYVPYGIAFAIPTNRIYGWTATCVFLADMLLNFRTAFYYFGHVVVDPDLIKYHYATHMFVIDLFATIPFELIAGDDNDAAMQGNFASKLTKASQGRQIHFLG